jgi:hypothetical protein
MCRTATSVRLLVCGGMLTGCTVEATPDQGPSEKGSMLQTFDVRLPTGTTEETVIPAIVAAGHDEIAAACDGTFSTSIRVFNPLAPGAYTDVPCSTMLDGTGEASSALTSDPSDSRLGQAQQQLSPFSLGCAAFVGGSALFSQFVLCPRARTERDRKHCDSWTGGGFFGLGLMCAFF